jgi:hypothetical protein
MSTSTAAMGWEFLGCELVMAQCSGKAHPKFLQTIYQDAAGKNTKKYMVIQVHESNCGRCQEFKISSVEQGKGIVRQGQQPSLGQQGARQSISVIMETE